MLSLLESEKVIVRHRLSNSGIGAAEHFRK